MSLFQCDVRREGQDGCTTGEALLAVHNIPATLDYSTCIEERGRAIELAKFFSAVSIKPGIADQPPLDQPRHAPDSNLTALAQLGTFKLDCERSFISLIDRHCQYIVGEATKSTPLLLEGFQSPTEPSASIYLGFRAIELSFGVCPQSIEIFTTGTQIDTPNISAGRDHYIIRDFKADPKFCERPYVTGWPHFGSYAEVPLISSSGFVIGTYCVIDSKPRQFGGDDIAIIDQVAKTIVNHLELLRTRQELNRVEGLVRGIGSYVAGYSGLKEQQTFSSSARSSANVAGDTAQSPRMAQGQSRPGLARNPSSSTASDRSSSFAKEMADRPTSSSDPESAPSIDPRDATSSPWKESVEAEGQDGVAREIGSALARAGNLLRQSMALDAVYFMDAADTQPIRHRVTLAKSHIDPQVHSGAGSSTCGILGRSTKGSDTLTESPSSSERFGMSRDLLRQLCSRYPFGHVFSFDELGFVSNPRLTGNYQGRVHPSRRGRNTTPSFDDHAEESLAAELFRVCEAHSVIFMPLWDVRKDRWFSAAVGWTTDPTRVLSLPDLNYVAVWGNSIMAEVSRLETSALSRAKSDFIKSFSSAISHELLSPLHGILAGTELLRKGASLNAEDASMLYTIDSCGNMLLDTINHLLDYAKINKLTHQRRSSSSHNVAVSAQDSAASRLSVIDLGEVLEDVVESVHLGQSARHQDEHLKVASHDLHGAGNGCHPDQRNSNDKVVLIDIDASAALIFETEVGAWKRIMMNLFGNACKYCQRGRIDVRLRLVPSAVDTAAEQYPADPLAGAHVCLEVIDTGQGMSESYLKQDLFTPFSQENSLAVGTGLGMSIVLQLVTDLGGSIDVQSALGVGTCVKVLVPVGENLRPRAAQGCLGGRTKRLAGELSESARGRKLFVSATARTAGDASPPVSYGEAQDTAVRALFAEVAGRWFGMDVVSEAPVEDPAIAGPFVLLRLPSQDTPSSSEWFLRTSGSQQPGLPAGQEGSLAKDIRLRQPFGPRTLATALAQAFSLPGQQEPVPISSPDPTIAAPAPSNGPIASPPSKSPDIVSPLPPTPSTPPPGTPKLHLLLVDDNAINLRVLSKCVTQIGCSYTLATDGQKAVDAYVASADKPFDLVFMDITMPVKDGFEATREIRELERARGVIGRVRIIALTALGSDDARKEAFASGIDLYMSKPVRMAEVRALVDGSGGEPS